MAHTKTVDLEEEVRRYEAELKELRQEAAEVDQDSDEADGIESKYKRLKKRRDGLERALNEWGSGVFVVKELTYGEIMATKDRVQEESYDADPHTGEMQGVPKDGYYQVEVLRVSIKESPPNAPDDPGDFPFQVGSVLYDKVDEMNTAKGVNAEDLWNQADGESS